MATDVLPLPPMARRPSDVKPEKPELPTDIVRVPVRMTRAQREKLHEIAFLWQKRAVEIVGGDWLVERVEAEYAKGRPKPKR